MFVPMEAYFDESGSHAGSHSLCIAGIIFRADVAEEFNAMWQVPLDSLGLPYFRMSECAHGNGVFKGIDKDTRIRLQTYLIDLIVHYHSAAVAITIKEDEYPEIAKEMEGAKHFEEMLSFRPYSFLAFCCLDTVIEHCDLQGYPWDGKISFFFESGHRDQREANKLMTDIYKDHPVLKTLLRYSSHEFISKDSTPAIQAADILAWQWYTDRRRNKEGKPRRADCQALFGRLNCLVTHIEPGSITAAILKHWTAGTLSREMPPGIIVEPYT